MNLERIREKIKPQPVRIGASLSYLLFFSVIAYIDEPYKLKDLASIDTLLTIAIILIGVYVFLTSIFLALNQPNEGWRRVTVVLVFLGGVAGSLIAHKSHGIHLKDIFTAIVPGFVLGVIATIFVILSGKFLIKWIKDGFQN